MFTIQLILLTIIGLIGIIFNWLLILAIQRKTYHHQETHRMTTPTSNPTLLQETKASTHRPTLRPPLSPSSRSSISLFEKYILAYLVNDIIVCNLLIPLRFIELYQGLPCVFFCFLWKFFERLTAIIEILISNFLLLTSLLFFYKKYLAMSQFYLLHLLLIIPLILIYLLPTLTYFDVQEYPLNQRQASCQQIYTFITRSTTESLNILCCFLTYLILLLQYLLVGRMKHAIRKYKQTSLKNLNETANITRNLQQEIDQHTHHYSTRRSMYSPSIHNVSNATSIATDLTPTTQRAFQPFDYLTYLTIIENSQTLVRSTYCLLTIYCLTYLPYWMRELFSWSSDFERFEDVYLICHIVKPFCYIGTNEKYRAHLWAILQCQPFRILPMVLRRKSRIVTIHKSNLNLNSI